MKHEAQRIPAAPQNSGHGDVLERDHRQLAVRFAIDRYFHRADALPMLVSVQLFSALKREGLEELRQTLSHAVEG